MIKAVIFDMFETLITLFTEHTYFGEDAASDAGVDPVLYRKVWHENEKDRTTGKMTIEEGIGETLQKTRCVLGRTSEDDRRKAALRAAGDI